MIGGWDLVFESEDRGVDIAVLPSEEEAARDQEKGHDRASRRKEDVEGEDIDGDGSEQHQADRGEASCEEQESAENLCAFNEGEHIACGGESAHKGPCFGGERWYGHKVEEAVESKDDPDQAGKDACSKDELVVGGFCGCRSKVR